MKPPLYAKNTIWENTSWNGAPLSNTDPAMLIGIAGIFPPGHTLRSRLHRRREW
ncbi:hypothetical protein [Haloferula sp. A504]|uniref:hypothetical protein n=1 Tax=Haloferula sp. A504 TaxID=3373601 RepID=UPI0031C8158C|nr:hypothetical protein [Verrucomicrobiaceae bacterium E54]